MPTPSQRGAFMFLYMLAHVETSAYSVTERCIHAARHTWSKRNLNTVAGCFCRLQMVKKSVFGGLDLVAEGAVLGAKQSMNCCCTRDV